MKKNQIHNGDNDFSEMTGRVISDTHIHWERSKEEIWPDMEKRMKAKEGKIIAMHSYSHIRMAVAAGLTLLIVASAFVSFYSKTIVVPAGVHHEVTLPDNSTAMLNAESTISYKPLIWNLARKVKLTGEAFFEVEKGKSFSVISERGITTVLGTSFNVYSRDEEYKVTCVTGKVMVEGVRDVASVTIIPGQQAVMDSEGALSVETGIDTAAAVSWIKNRLNFTSTPLREVFAEIKRQYDIDIEIKTNIDNTYTGAFFKDSSAQNVLNLVCRPFDLTVIPKSDNEYIITRN